MLPKDFIDGIGLDLNTQCISLNRQAAALGKEYFIDVNLMPDYMSDEEEWWQREPAVSYDDVKGEPCLQIDITDKDGKPLHTVSNYMTEDAAVTFLDGYEAAVCGLCDTPTVHKSVSQIKRREQRELAAALRRHGRYVDGGIEYRFSGDDRPVIAAYDHDTPCDVYVHAARMDYYRNIHLLGCDTEDPGDPHRIPADEIFAGELDYVTAAIGK